MRGQSALVALLAACGVAGCGLCGDEALVTTYSPDRRYFVQSFVRNCGATTDYATWVRLTKRYCLMACSTTPYVENGYRAVQPSWEGSGRLVVACQGCAVRQDRQWDDVLIHFREPAATTPSPK